MRKFPLGAFAPDMPDMANGGLEEALNCIPYVDSYGPFPDAVEFTTALSARCQGAASARGSDGNALTFSGDEKKLYRLVGITQTDVSRTVTYATSQSGRWEFEQFGDTFLGVNGADAMQVWTLGTSARFRDQSASASAPLAAHIAGVRDFIMVGNLVGEPNVAAWCQINNPLRFTQSVARQSDRQPLPGPGAAIKRILGGDFAAILTEGDVWRATYVGSPLVFRFDQVAPGIGCRSGGSAARFQNMTYFWSTQGFFAFDGQQALPIGYEQVDEWFAARVNISFVDRMSAVIDPKNKLYILAYPTTGSPDGTPNELLIYSWAAQRWAHCEIMLELLYNGLSVGTDLDSLDAIYPAGLDSIPVSLDSAIFQGGTVYLGAFSTAHKAASFEGAALAATFTTGEMQLIQDSRAFVTAIKPLVQGSAASVITARVGQRGRVIDPVVWGNASAMNASGLCPLRSDGRFHRVRFDVAGGFDRAMGFDGDYRRVGKR